MHEPSSPLTHVFSVSSFCKTYAPQINPSVLYFPLLYENRQNDNFFIPSWAKF